MCFNGMNEWMNKYARVNDLWLIFEEEEVDDDDHNHG